MVSPEIVYSEIFTTQRLGYFSKDYDLWKPKIDFILSTKGISYVLHTPQPPDEPATRHLREKWIQDDAMCQYLILRSVQDNAFFISYGETTAKSVLDDIDSHFATFNHPQLIQHNINLVRSYVSRRMSDVTRISKHVLDMKFAARELEAAGVRVPEEMQAVVLMNSLPESWNDLACLLNLQLVNESELGFDNVSRRLRVGAEMRPRRGRGGGGNNAGNRGFCCLCRQQGHSLSNCPEDQCSEENSNLGNDFPFTLEEMNIYDMNYHKLKTSKRLNYTGTNFTFWKSRLSLVFRGLGIEYVLKHPKPSEPTESTPQIDVNIYNKWLVDDTTCRHLILGAMEDDLLGNFRDQLTAKALMGELDVWFDFPSLGRRMALFKQYVECRMSDETSIDDHLFHMTKMVRELNRAGIEVPDEIQAAVLVNSLPGSWTDIILTITHRCDKEIKDGKKLLDTVKRSVRDAGQIRALNERMNSNNNYHGISVKGYKRKY